MSPVVHQSAPLTPVLRPGAELSRGCAHRQLFVEVKRTRRIAEGAKVNHLKLQSATPTIRVPKANHRRGNNHLATTTA